MRREGGIGGIFAGRRKMVSQNLREGTNPPKKADFLAITNTHHPRKIEKPRSTKQNCMKHHHQHSSGSPPMGTLPPSPAKLSLLLLPFLAADLPYLLRQHYYCLISRSNIFLNNNIMSSSNYSPVFESRYAAFIIWSIFILAFIVVPFLFVPLKILFGRICRSLCLSSILGRRYPQHSDDEDYYDNVDDGRPPVYSVWDVEYMHLSQGKKHQINEIRAREIGKCLATFSLVLSEKNMVSRQSSSSSDDQGEYDASQDCIMDVKDAKNALDQGKEGGSTSNDDTTEASITEPYSSSSTDASSSINVEQEAITYTHIRLPQPGYNKYGIRKLKKKPKSKSATEHNRTMMGHLVALLFRRETKDDDAAAANNIQANKKALSDMEDDAEEDTNGNLQQTTDNDDDDRRRRRLREVPIFCAICLGEFEPSETVCWSSNMECTHVFHHDCMHTWLKSLGKRVCKQQRFSENPTVKQVLNFSLECPCCRQSFIDKSVVVSVGGGGGGGDDENV